MAIYLAKMDFQYDSALPRDAMTITPHFFGDQPQALADALKTNLLANAAVGATVPFKIRIYDAQKAKPNYPLAEAINGTGSVAYGTVPREVALCLSYYSNWNRPRYRGRLYIPAKWAGGTQSDRPTSTQRQNIVNLKSLFTAGLPASHNWVVFSKMNNQSYGVTHVWCDDEWDIVRSRGLRGTTRTLGTVP